MADVHSTDLIHVSGALFSPGIVAQALDDTARGVFVATAFNQEWNGSRLEEVIQSAWDRACTLYDDQFGQLDSYTNQEEAERLWIRPLLKLLGHTRAAGVPVVALPVRGRPELDELDRPGPGGISPHEALQRRLNDSPRAWGLLISPRRLRLMRSFHHTVVKGYVAFDLDAIFESRDFPAFRALFRLSHPSRFEGDRPPLEQLYEEGLQHGTAVGRALQRNVRRALMALAEGLLDAGDRSRLDDGEQSRKLFAELLRVVYRLLFLLFAEQRKMVPTDGLYAETYAVERLLHSMHGRGIDPDQDDLWEGLKVTFELFHKGDPKVTGVFGYNGQLFDPTRTPTLLKRACPNRAVLDALDALAWVEVGGLRQRVNYRFAGTPDDPERTGVEELGSVYESLLNYTLRRASSALEVDGQQIPRGGLYLAPLATERKDLGAFYTPSRLVDFVLSESLDKLIEERLAAAGADSQARQVALLDLRVCDPACGSGTFLIGAIEHLARALAKARSAEERYSDEDMQVARRHVLGSCIYGVDKDPFAVELCKVSLWLHCAVKDLPLSFLDHRIQHGDSLVGWPLLAIPTELPEPVFTVPSKVRAAKDEASQRLKHFLDRARDANNLQRAGQTSLFDGKQGPDIHVDAPALLFEDERTPADVQRKAEAFREWEQSDTYRRWTAAADLWTSAFFWRPELGPAPLHDEVRAAVAGKADTARAKAAAEALEVFPAFHWPLRFPEIRKRGGFDCMIGNPPWEQFENREEEFFALKAPALAELRGARRKAEIETLALRDPRLATDWKAYALLNERTAIYTRTSGRFTLYQGKANTYLLFTDLFADFMRGIGRSGVVVKSALALDQGGGKVFGRLVEKGLISGFFDIVNGGAGRPVFPAVAAVERFAVVILGPIGRVSFDVSMMNGSVEEARSPVRIPMSADDLRILNPVTRTLASFKSIGELEIARAVHRTFRTLDFEDGGSNPWGLRYATLFNSTTDSGDFSRPEQLAVEQWRLDPDRVFRRARAGTLLTAGQINLFSADRTTDEEAWPLYEGQLLNRYDHRVKSYHRYEGPNKYGMKPDVPLTTDEEKADPHFEIEPRYWMLASVARARLHATVDQNTMIGFRDVARPISDSRCAKAAIMPYYPATDTLPILSLSRELAPVFVAIFNSIPFDFLVRGKMPGAHVKTMWMLSQLPTPAPDSLDPRIAQNARKLSLTSWSVCRPFKAQPHPWDPEERYHLDVETDALVAHAYKLTRAQYETIFDTFDVLARKEIAAHGHFKFKKDCLNAHRRLG